jgi:hypothetical protein
MEYEQSGQTRRAFCLQHGLSLATLDNYRRQSSGGPGQAQDGAPTAPSAAATTFVPVELVERSSWIAQASNSGASLYVELASGWRIGVVAGFDAATLTRLIAVLQQA